jgi:hypothetical protein
MMGGSSGASRVSRMVKRVRVNAKSKSISKSLTLTPGRLTLFGEPQLLEGEDAAAYEELLARIQAAVKPVDVIDEMFIVDVVALEWEVLRWRRLKLGLIRARVLERLKAFLVENLDYDLYRNDFADELAEVLQDNLPEGQEKDFAQTLAHQCAENEPHAVEKVEEILNEDDRELDQFRKDVRADKVEELSEGYARRDPDAVTLINECLVAAGVSMDSLVADALGKQFDYIERLDHLTTIAENRRNAALREIDRRRAALGETVRRTVQGVEDAEFKVIETRPAKGKDAA